MRIAVRSSVRLFSGIGALVAGALLGASAVRADGGALYRWETADGTLAFTDDAKRVPERYRESAETIDRSMLGDYGRYTPTDAAANEEHARRLHARLAGLRAANAEEAVREAEASGTAGATASVATAPVTRDIHRRRRFTRPDGTSYYRYYEDHATVEGSGLSLPVDPNDPNPVVTEKRRVRVPGEPITQTLTVTRQGDRVLSVVAPRSHYHDIEFGELSDFEVVE